MGRSFLHSHLSAKPNSSSILQSGSSLQNVFKAIGSVLLLETTPCPEVTSTIIFSQSWKGEVEPQGAGLWTSRFLYSHIVTQGTASLQLTPHITAGTKSNRMVRKQNLDIIKPLYLWLSQSQLHCATRGELEDKSAVAFSAIHLGSWKTVPN